MTEKTMQELLDQYDEAIASLERGDVIEGRIHSLGSEYAVVTLDHMFDGVCELKELMDDERETELKLSFVVIRIDDEQGQVVLSRRLAREEEVLESLGDAVASEAPVEVAVKEVIKGGLRVDYRGIRGFMPFSQIDLAYVEVPDVWVGEILKARVIRWEEDERNLVVSRRALLEEQRQERETAFYDSLAVDQVLKGKVHKLFRAGALIDLGDAFGYLHITDASWRRVSDMAEMLHPGDEVEVKVKAVDAKEKRISLSLKDITVNPWEVVREDYAVGDIVYGKMLKDVGSGVLVELETGIVGYIHKSQLVGVKWHVGQEIAVEIETIDPEAQRMGLKYFDEEAVADDFPAEEEEQTTLGDLFGDLFDKFE